MDNFGIWAMLAFWGSAIGGILFAVSWAKSRGRDGASRDAIERSLKKRLEAGELTEQDYQQRLADLDRKP